MSRRRRQRARLFARLVALTALALTAALLWRWLWAAPPQPDTVRSAVPIPARTLGASGTQARPEQEEIDTLERQGLENILRQKNTARQR